MLSVVFGTYNRLERLKACIASVRASAGKTPLEFCITDGGSTDGTLDYLRSLPDVRLIEHGKLRGPVAAYNDAFSAARGDVVAYLNDDLVCNGDILQAAHDVLLDLPSCGLLSFPYQNRPGEPLTLPYSTIKSGRYLFASFGALRLTVGRHVGWFSGFYYHYCGDSHMAMSIRDTGLDVLPFHGYSVTHFCDDNALRGANRWDAPNAKGRGRADVARFGKLWDNWEKPGDGYNEEAAWEL